jgi:hypothetical protein
MNAREAATLAGGHQGQRSATHRRSRRQHQHNRFSGCSNGIPGSAYGRAAIASAIDSILFAPGGFRHHESFKQAAALGELIAGGELRDESRVGAFLIGAARKAGLADRDAERTILRGLKRGKQSPRRAPQSAGLRDHLDALEEIERWWRSVLVFEWSGRRGAMALRILRGFRDIAIQARKVRISASVRQVAEVAGVGRQTVSAYRYDLSPFLRVVSRGSRIDGSSTVWQLIPRSVSNTDRPEAIRTGEGRLSENETSPTHDVFDGRASMWRIYSVLGIEESTRSSDIVATTSLGRSTVWRGLRQLEAYGFAERVGVEWRALPLDDLTGLASARRRRRHELDRQAWQRWRAERVRTSAGDGR